MDINNWRINSPMCNVIYIRRNCVTYVRWIERDKEKRATFPENIRHIAHFVQDLLYNSYYNSTLSFLSTLQSYTIAHAPRIIFIIYFLINNTIMSRAHIHTLPFSSFGLWRNPFPFEKVYLGASVGNLVATMRRTFESPGKTGKRATCLPPPRGCDARGVNAT